MSDSLRLSVPDFDDPWQREAFFDVAAAAIDVDGHDPFNEQARLDVESGRRSPIIVTLWPGESAAALVRPVGAAILGRGELDFVIDPLFRGKGYGELAARGLLATARGTLTAWSNGDHPAAKLLAERHGFTPVRALIHLAATLDEGMTRPGTDTLPDGFSLGPMRPGDEQEWVDLNARIFDTHPEQGRLTVDDLHARQAEPWFDAGDALLLRDASGRLVGYGWVKIEPGATEGALYVLGVDAALTDRGLGRQLLRAALARLVERGCTVAGLSVEADNEPAVHLFRALGFQEQTIDVQYRRASDPGDPFIHS
ncbi:mycothiol synthase [Leifsonia poae]|uniref:mycothiol synthase n=1 Tax=Leifsonia poae TaxID=110933 RepID=UPI001CBCC340|nr:mycothiol synthase [Leifsonia poae]